MLPSHQQFLSFFAEINTATISISALGLVHKVFELVEVRQPPIMMELIIYKCLVRILYQLLKFTFWDWLQVRCVYI